MLRITKFNLGMLITCLFILGLNPFAVLAQGSDAHIVVNAYRLNVRTGPGVGHSIITELPGGTALPVTMLSADRKWYEVAGGFGRGWLRSAYAIPRGDFSNVPMAGAPTNLGGSTIDAMSSAARLVINTSYLNARTGPGAGHSVLTVLPGGTVVAAIARDRGGVWYQVKTSAGNAWVNTRYTVGRGDFSGIPTVDGPAPTAPASTGSMPHLVVNTSYLNVRSGPSARHDVILTVPGGTKLPAVGIAPNSVWYEVATAVGNGWVNTRYTVGRGDFSNVKRYRDSLQGNAPRAVVNTSFINVRTGPGISYNIAAVVPGGTTLPVLGKSVDGKWFLVQGDFGQAWLRNRYVAFRGVYSQVPVAS